jgi:hypothetical protein
VDIPLLLKFCTMALIIASSSKTFTPVAAGCPYPTIAIR